MHECPDERTDGCTSEQTNAQTNECTNARTDGREGARMRERTNARTDEYANERKHRATPCARVFRPFRAGRLYANADNLATNARMPG